MNDKADKKYIAKLINYTRESVRLFSNPKKSERERMAFAAFLRCLGIKFLALEIELPEQNDNKDINFRGARFQIAESFDRGRKRGDEYKAREEMLIMAKNIEDTLLPIEWPSPISYEELFEIVAKTLSKKNKHYGGHRGCASLDALVHINRKRFLDMSSSKMTTFDKLESQGWRSVSLLFPPYSHVIFAKRDAPEFLKINAGQTKNENEDPDCLFELN
jgi:hypothetical protein